jgi:hypothetical protein
VFKLVYEKGARRLETAEVAMGPNVYYLGKIEPERYDCHLQRARCGAALYGGVA